MDLEAERANAHHNPLKFQLDVPWENASQETKSQCVDKAREDCLLVCNMIAPESGAELYNALTSQHGIEPSPEMEALMTAYRNAKTSGLRTQILSLYAFKYPIPVLMKLHEPYEKITRYQVKRARSHAKLHGPGTIPEKEMKHRVRLDMAKVDHFLEFANRPYFYQDVAYGSRVLNLDSGEKIPMPNIIRTVTRSTMVKQYQSFCEEENFNPLRRSTLFKILDVRQASQRRSLQGLDNIAADGAAGFQTMERIVDDLKEKGIDREWCVSAKRRMQEGKRYLKTDYRVHCSEESSPCKDHCRKFALSDPVEKDFTEECDHEHNLRCDMCEDLNDDVMNDVKRQICDHLLLCTAKNMRRTCCTTLNTPERTLFSGKAMFCDRRSFRQRGSPTYAHLFDCCQQDWFAVCSIFDNLLENVLASRPSINSVFLRSDEAGCYHNNALVASLKDVGQRLGVHVCDRILCPMKSSIRCYCDEGHDINCAVDMRTALLERPVRGVTASVCAIDEKKNTINVNKINGLSKLHNFAYDDKGIRVWRAYGIGPGKLISLDDVITEQQGKTGPIVQESGDFFTLKEARQLNIKNLERIDTEESTEEGQLFECSEPGCEKLFKSFREC
ncbi:hypothetical protein ACROYT_G022126 [Oculina patagonica]